jgi:hypothetical protein
MTAASAFRAGSRRVNRAPLLVAGMAAVTLLVALPLSLALRGMIETHLGHSLMADQVASATSYDWWQEFSAQASGLSATFVPSIIGFGAVLDNLSGLADNLPLASTIVGVTAAWMIVWSFLSGGLLDRLARDRATRAHGFFAACGVHFWRFARLGAIAFLFYYVLFTRVHGWLLTDLYEVFTQNTTVERTAFAVRVLLYLAFGAMLAFTSLMLDYARIRIVVEDRRSAIGGLLAGVRFVLRRPGGTIGLYVLNAAAFVALVLAYAVAAPGAPRSGIAMWLILALGQLYIVARHYLKLVFYASQTAYFQGALAHAAFGAPPPAVWPDSPAAEAIANGEGTVRR